MSQRLPLRVALAIIAVIVCLLTVISTSQLKPIDKTLFDSASYILERLPLSFYVNFSLVIVAIIFSLIISYLNSFNKVTLCFYLFFVLMYLLLLEFPRFLYPNAFQVEYFHQAQIYHVLNVGTVTDKGYSFPKSDVAHAIFGATFILISGLFRDFTISHILPLIVKLALLISVCTMSTSFLSELSNPTKKLYALLVLVLPLYVIISDTEPLFINHYSYAMPLYVLLLYEILEKDLRRKVYTIKSIIVLTIIAMSLLITHIYYSTLLVLTLFLLASIALLKSSRSNKIVILSYLSLILAYFLWHAIASEWTMEQVKAELSTLNIAIRRLIGLQLSFNKPIASVEERFGNIPVKKDYLLYVKLKLCDVIILQLSVMVLVLLVIFTHSKNFVRELFSKDITVFALLSIIFFFIYAGTFTAHEQRVLEHLVLSVSAFVIVILHSARRINSFVRAVILIVVAIIIVSLPFKLVYHWGTSLTYIGFSTKTIHMLYFFGHFTKKRLRIPIYYIGANPYWFLTEIVSRKENLLTINLNRPSNSILKTLESLNSSLSCRKYHYIVIDLSWMFFMRAKYKFEQYIKIFIEKLLSLISRVNIVFNEGVAHIICVSTKK